MAHPKEQISSQRLFEASEAILLAVVEVAEKIHGAWPYPPSLLGTPMQPRCLDDFTRWEIEEATSFLVRLGILDAPTQRRAS